MSCRYLGLSRADTRPPNNTVNVSDLIAKPGSPSIISAPIDHSSQGTGDTNDGNKAKQRQTDSSADTIRRPLSSTIDRYKEGTGSGSRDPDNFTSGGSQSNDGHASHVPVLDGSVFHGRKSDVDKDSSENDSQRSSEASLSGGYLSVRNLTEKPNKPVASLDDSWTKGRQAKDLPKEKQHDGTNGNAYLSHPIGRASLDNAWGKPHGDSVILRERPEHSLGRDSTLGINSTLSLPGTGENQSLPLDSVWKINELERVAEDEKHEHEERAKREREDHEKREHEEREKREHGEREKREHGEREKREHGEREKREHEKREHEEREHGKREHGEREREEREWEDEKRKREELRHRREEEAWEREQRELAELREA